MDLAEHCLPYSFVDLLKQRELHQIIERSHESQFKKGEYIFQADNAEHSIYILLQGRIKISRISHLGNELIQWFCLPGDIFGIAGENHLSNNVYARALTECQVLKIKKTSFDQLLLSEPGISLLVIDKLSSRIHALGDMVLYMASDNANTRFIKLLQHMSDNYGKRFLDNVYIDIPITHQDLADMIGSCRQTVSGIISGLKREGILNINRKGINIYKPNQLLSHLRH
jgi:CRP/FNR family transcriptional regulator